MSEEKQYIATMRLVFFEEDDVQAAVTAELIRERAAELIEEEDSLDVTQVIPLSLTAPVEPLELVNNMLQVSDMLVATRINECYELARELHRIAWVLEHRSEPGYEHAGYDYYSFIERANNTLQRIRKG